jgi:hypothetical protein
MMQAQKRFQDEQVEKWKERKRYSSQVDIKKVGYST